MVTLTRINDTMIVINAEHIEFIESTPDTMVALTNGHKYMVKDSVEEVVKKIKEYKRSLFKGIMSVD